MSAFPEYGNYDAVGLAELVRRREVTAGDLLAEARTRCDRINPELNAVIYRRDGEAGRDAAAMDPELQLAGVPFLVKDLGPGLGGTPQTSGSRLFAKYVPEKDGEIVRRFRGAGLVVLGKTNTSEFGLLPVTETELLGICRNPWDTGRTPGGSSGGSAAAVSAGIVPIAHASDGGGSIRIPASCCGLFGLKPSRGLNPKDAMRETLVSDFSVDHVLSRTVRDAAAALDAICNKPAAGFQASLENAPKALRIGVVRGAMLGSKVAPEVRAALDNAVTLLTSLGHRVEDAEPQVDYEAVGLAFLTYWSIGAKQGLAQSQSLVGRTASREDVELTTWMLATVGGAMSAADTGKAKAVIESTNRTFADFLNAYDILLSPTLATPPLKIGQNALTAPEKAAMGIVSAIKSPWLYKTLLKLMAAKSFAFASFTAPFNMTGQPAMSVPLHWTAEGLPIGIHFAAKAGADGLLLKLARQLENAQPWIAKRPPVWAS